MKRYLSIAIMLAMSVVGEPAMGQTGDVCKAFLDKPIFTATTTQSTGASKENFRLFECSADFKSASDAQKAGIDVTIPIYDIPVPFSANWDDNKVETWKSSHCSATERANASNLTYYQAVYATNPVSANDALACYQAWFQAQDGAAVRCDLTETPNAYVFSARWRRTAGETGAAPSITSFTALNSTCTNTAALANGTALSEGGVPLLCSVGADAGAFALTTTRGGCSASGRYRAPKLVMPTTLELTGPFTQVADQMEFPANATIVTNGYPLSLSADQLTILGPLSIKSFKTPTAAPSTVGSSASSISLVAKQLHGTGGITVLNSGQDEGIGSSGAKGPPGNPGDPGTGRTTQWTNVCKNLPWPLNTVCQLTPTGCEGGVDGTPGSTGGTGYPGNPGLSGGAAGPVYIDVDPDGRKLISVLTDVGMDGKAKSCQGAICGGSGGPGGGGGPGGDGGTGGPGASGTPYCGGTNAGGRGGLGGPGPTGPSGPAGQPAQVRG